MAKETLGELEELVLLAIARFDDDAHGLSIVEELSTTAGRVVYRSSVYVLKEAKLTRPDRTPST